MITSWKLFNFKSVKNETTLDFGPLTIFAGANSSGKSTLIQSILLISQTLSHRVRSRSVVLNGLLTRLGQFDDLKSFSGDANEIVIGWECVPLAESPLLSLDSIQPSGRRAMFYGRNTDHLKNVTCQLAFDSNPGSPQQELFQLQPQLFSCRVATTARSDENIDIKSWIEIRKATLYGGDAEKKFRALNLDTSENDLIQRSLDLDVSIDEESGHEINEDYVSAEPVGCVPRHFLPETLSLKINVPDEECRAIVTTVCEGARASRRRTFTDREILMPQAVLTGLRETLGDSFVQEVLMAIRQQAPGDTQLTGVVTLRAWSDGILRLPPSRRVELRKIIQDTPDLAERLASAFRQTKSDHFVIVPYRLPNYIRDGVTYLDWFFSSSVKYLGPLRDEPKPLYPLAAGADPLDVGLRGEYTAAVYDLHKSQRIRYIPTSVFLPAEIKSTTSLRTLEAAVTDWLHYLGVAESVLTIDKGKLGHEMKVVPLGLSQPHDLTHVGVGVSQVLPILVMCLLAEPDTTLIFEQPEIHLHPRVQTLLGDFFLSMSLLGKQCILETHSEYLVNRLRFRAAAAESADIAKRIKMYFVEKQGESSSFRPVVVNEFGAIADWPEGFFDQSQKEAEATLRAAMNKRRQAQRRQP
jgi:predicted ATPase